MKKFLLVLVLLSSVLSVSAANISDLPYKSIKDKTDISVSDNGQIWSTKFSKKNSSYYIKNGDVFCFPDGTPAFSINSPYMFLLDNRLIGYSNSDLKFYEYSLIDGQPEKRELSIDEVKIAFNKYKIIKISDFNENTNSLKIKKKRGCLKLIILNDTENLFEDYKFSSGNAKFETYPAAGFINVKKAGMIQLSRDVEDSKDYPWFVLLIR